MTKGKQYLAGVRMGIPVIFGFIPVGIAFAIAARQAGFSLLETQLMSLSVFAGASQIMSVGMWAEGAGIIAIILATLIINLRHIIMSTCVMNRLGGASPLTRLLLAFGVTDESFAIFTGVDEVRATPAFLFGVITVTYSSWNVGTLLGALGADLLPETLTMAFGVALYAMFIAIITPDVSRNWRLLLLVILAALMNFALSLVLDSSWAMVISTLASALAGVFFVDLDGGEGDSKVGADSAALGATSRNDSTPGEAERGGE
jgi:4-azaleucine resistance transporter AzlC